MAEQFKATYHGKTKDARIRVNMRDGSKTFPEFIAGKAKVVDADTAAVLQKFDDFTVSEVVAPKTKK